MVLETPLFLQETGGDAAITFSARQVRSVLQGLVDAEGVLNGPDLLVTQRGSGANNSVDVAAGWAAVNGESVTNQGRYYVRSTATANITASAAPGTGTRTDLVYLQIRDKESDGGANYDFVLAIATGTTTAPTSAIPLAQLTRTAGDTSITTAMVTDVRPWARTGSWGVLYRGYNSAPSSGWTSTTDIVVQTLTSVQLYQGRKYEVRSYAPIGNNGGSQATDFVRLKHKLVGLFTDIVGTYDFVADTAITGLTPNCINFVSELDGIQHTGVYTINLTAENLSGTGNHNVIPDATTASIKRPVIKLVDMGAVA